MTTKTKTKTSIYPTPEQAKAARHMAEMIAIGMAMRGNPESAAAIRVFADGMTGLTATDVDLSNTQDEDDSHAPR
jgi:hypothetical protein